MIKTNKFPNCILASKLISPPFKIKEEAPIINDLYRKIIQKSAALDGVYSAEHGTGKRKTIDFVECYGEKAVEQVKECKIGFDPNLVLNIGNIVSYD